MLAARVKQLENNHTASTEYTKNSYQKRRGSEDRHGERINHAEIFQ